MSRTERPVTQTFGYKPTLKDGKAADKGTIVYAQPDDSMTSPRLPIPQKQPSKSASSASRLTKPNQGVNDIVVLRAPRDEKLAKTFPKRLYHHLMTIDQAGPAVIGVDDTDRRKRVAIKRVRKPEGSVYQVPPSSCD